MRHERAARTARLVRELDAEIGNTSAYLALLERARGAALAAELGSNGRCDAWSHTAPCAGETHARFCRGCGNITRRCEAHGGNRAAGHAADEHRASCPGSDARDPAAHEPSGVQGRSEPAPARKPVPVGGVPVPPAARGRVSSGSDQVQATQAQGRAPSYHPPAQHPRAQANGPASGVAVIRRRVART